MYLVQVTASNSKSSTVGLFWGRSLLSCIIALHMELVYGLGGSEIVRKPIVIFVLGGGRWGARAENVFGCFCDFLYKRS